MLQGLLRLILYILIGYILYNVILYFKAANKKIKNSRQSKNPSNKMVKDEVCKTYLPEEEAIKEKHQGKWYYFCSKECRKKFLQSKK